jgi:hypothetical protein
MYVCKHIHTYIYIYTHARTHASTNARTQRTREKRISTEHIHYVYVHARPLKQNAGLTKHIVPTNKKGGHPQQLRPEEDAPVGHVFLSGIRILPHAYIHAYVCMLHILCVCVF